MTLLLAQIAFTWQAYVAQVVGFLLLLFLLHRFAWGKISNFLQARQHGIQSTISKIEKDQKDLESRIRDYEQKVAEIEKLADRIKQQQVQEALEQRRVVLEEAQRQATELIEKARRDIEIEKDKAILDLKRQIVQLTLAATERILDQTVDEKVHGSLVEQYLVELDKAK